MRQSACLVANPIVIDNYAASFNCTLEGHRGSTGVFLLLQVFSDVVWRPELSVRMSDGAFCRVGVHIEKLGYAGIYLFFLFLIQNIDYGYSLEPPRLSGSNVYPQSMF